MFPLSPRFATAFALALPLGLLAGAGACSKISKTDDRPRTARAFPPAQRAVSAASPGFDSEGHRDSRSEARTVMDLAAIGPGMSVADVGAGAGYYTVRLAHRVGKHGRVLAEDVDRAASDRLGSRILREGLENVSLTLGRQDDPSLPGSSFDRVLLVHVYHEVSEPYAFLWRLRPALRPGGKVVVVDSDRPSGAHGIAPAQLFCEFGAVGLRLTEFVRKPQLQGYYAEFEAAGTRPEPAEIRPCRMEISGGADGAIEAPTVRS